MSTPAPAVPLEAQLALLNTAQPWFAPHATALVSCRQAVATGASVADALNALPRLPAHAPHFVPADALPQGEAYEAFIARTGTVPTRDNLHDLFNGLCWRQFPQAKRRLNQLQAACIERDGVGAVRGPVRDALTLLDENGALLQAPAEIWQALRERQWQRLFGELRPRWQQVRVVLLGHALLEKLVSPRKDLTAHVCTTPGAMKLIADDDLVAMDAALAGGLDDAVLATKPFTPLPVLGIPGWWAANENFSFYDDSQTFRPRRTP